MKTDYRLRKNKDFQHVYRKGKSVASRSIVMIHLPLQELKVGFCVSKKVGNSVCRNRVKRLMKEAFRSVLPNVGKAKIVFVARVAIVGKDYEHIRKEMIGLLKRGSLWKDIQA
jgi:ribonuclease P protein component